MEAAPSPGSPSGPVKGERPLRDLETVFGISRSGPASNLREEGAGDLTRMDALVEQIERLAGHLVRLAAAPLPVEEGGLMRQRQPAQSGPFAATFGPRCRERLRGCSERHLGLVERRPQRVKDLQRLHRRAHLGQPAVLINRLQATRTLSS